ncbi:acetolactate decarboxylase [Ulvibacterium marinum]|uniref:acetolactate decarboxylase n=1 Tax=Ulvibacterium marinum TaxID=2419782 RepID=UPI0024949FCE|nr:acetolactate decarboxylase [Ulvibacterium marinum]
MKITVSKFFALIGLLIVLNACKEEAKPNIAEVSEKKIEIVEKPDLFYHYSIWHAFVNKIFEGDITAGELKTKGDIGLGSYNFLDGELIMLNGQLYQAKENGKVVKPSDDIKIAYANATFFDTDDTFNLQKVPDYETLRKYINEKLPTKNIFYAFKIHGEFSKMKCGGLHKQEKPFDKGLDYLIPNRPIFERENFTGTMVGFFCPEFIGDINASGYHLHFVSDDETFAGHVMEFEAKNLKVEIDRIHEYQFVLPQTEEYRNVGFEKEFQYKKQ